MKGGRQAMSLEDRINKTFDELNISDSLTRDRIRNSLSGLSIKNNDVVLKQLIQTILKSIDDENHLA